ncbi:MAG: hypothetical protein KJP02_00115 [Octadecabacter sp.]|nr:hypothetical protein [Octadecabacter sp.]
MTYLSDDCAPQKLHGRNKNKPHLYVNSSQNKVSPSTLKQKYERLIQEKEPVAAYAGVPRRQQRIFGPSMETEKRVRLAEVGVLVWRIISVGIVLFVLFWGLLFWDTMDGEDTIVLLLLYTAYAFIAAFAAWAINYVRTGEMVPFFAMMRRAVFGNIPYYFWFVPLVLYFAGLANSFAYMDEHHGEFYNGSLWLLYSEGMGVGVMFLFFGSPGWFFAPKEQGHVGHMIGTIFVAVLWVAMSMAGLSEL